jgi:hypothetical protein
MSEGVLETVFACEVYMVPVCGKAWHQGRLLSTQRLGTSDREEIRAIN